MTKQVSHLDFSGKKIYVGIDCHLRSWNVTILLENSFQKTFHQDPKVDLLLNYLKRHYPKGEYIFAYEAGFSGYWTQEKIAEQGSKCLVVHAADIPTTDKERRQKTDRRDSKKIAMSLRGGALESIYIPTKQQQRDRSLVRQRYRINKDKRRVMSRIRMHLHFYGELIPEGFKKGCWSKRFIDWLESLAKDRSDETLSLELEALKLLRSLELKALRGVRALSTRPRHKPSVDLLLSVPGIGLLTAMLFITEIGQIERFDHLDKLCSYVGLIPNTSSSGDTDRVGHMTKRANKRLKAALIESAWIAIHRDPALALAFEGWCQKTGQKNKAIVKVARKLLNRIMKVWESGEKYEFGR